MTSKMNFKILGSCMVCGTEFNEVNAEIFKEDQWSIFIHIDCPKCLSSSIITISNFLGPNPVTFGMMTDLTKNDLKNFDQIEKLTSDDVLTYHNYVKQN